MAIQCKKRRISFLSGHSFYLTLGEKVRGARGGGGVGLKVPWLNLNFPHFVTFPNLSGHIWVCQEFGYLV